MLSAALLRVPARRLRGLALGDEGALRDWIANESAWRLAEARRDVRIVAESIERVGARVVTLASADYPIGLRDLRDPPPFLIVRGVLPRERAGTAIIGSRLAESRAAAYARELARITPAPIVSGLALGIDAAAHRGALDVSQPTIAYVAHGLGATYPPEHAELEDEIVRCGGAIASERLPNANATSSALVRRDRLQAAHARAVVLVQSEPDGGAMHTMRYAADLGRVRFALRRDEFAGNALAIAGGAIALTGNANEDAIQIARHASISDLSDARRSKAPRLF